MKYRNLSFRPIAIAIAITNAIGIGIGKGSTKGNANTATIAIGIALPSPLPTVLLLAMVMALPEGVPLRFSCLIRRLPHRKLVETIIVLPQFFSNRGTDAAEQIYLTVKVLLPSVRFIARCKRTVCTHTPLSKATPPIRTFCPE